MQNRTQVARRAFCLVCGSEDLAEVIRIPAVPAICNQLLYNVERARQVARADIDLVGCRCCGHMFNAAFDPGAVDYNEMYENSLMGSPRYRQYTIGLIERLLSAYDLKGGTVVEIGCGRGEFLRMLCDGGMRRAIGFDPGRPGETTAVGDAALTIIGAPFDVALAPRADLVCARHVLEHLPSPISLLVTVRMAYLSRPPRVLLLEVPNGRHTIDQLGIWDLIYEHVSYFTPSSLSWALRSAGFVADQIETTFGGQFLVVEAQFDPPAAVRSIGERTCNTGEKFESFRAGFANVLDAWGSWLGVARQTQRRLALWGAGAKGAMFLNFLDRCDGHAIAQVIDINPLKAGAFVAGTGHPIAPPSALCECQPDGILLMNPEYEAEVRQILEGLDVSSELITVSGGLPPMTVAAI